MSNGESITRHVNYLRKRIHRLEELRGYTLEMYRHLQEDLAHFEAYEATVLAWIEQLETD